MRDEIWETVNLTASAGIACNKMLAKICTDVNKPNGQFYLKPDRDVIVDFMSTKNVRKVPGIGTKTEFILNGIEIQNCADILNNKVKLHFA